MGLPFSETIDCLHGKLQEKTPKRSKRLSQSCRGSSNISNSTNSSGFTFHSEEKALKSLPISNLSYSPRGTHDFNRMCLTHSSCGHRDIRKSWNSICTTISAISNLNETDPLKERCFPCSLDGLKVLHPRCDARVVGGHKIESVNGSINVTVIHGDGDDVKSEYIVGASSTNILNATFLSSVTLHSTWPNRRGNLSRSQEELKGATGDDIDLMDTLFSDSLEIVSAREEDSGHKDDKSCSTAPTELIELDWCDEDGPSLAGDSVSPELIGHDPPYIDGICEDWDDGHETHENFITTHIAHKHDPEIDGNEEEEMCVKSDVDVDVYTVSEKSGDKILNEVMSSCDWSFLQDSKRKKKQVKKIKKLSLLLCEEDDMEGCDSVSSCSQSNDEMDDDGSIDQFFMNAISRKKKLREKQSGIEVQEPVKGKENRGGPIICSINRSIGDTGCLSTASTIARVQHY